MIRSLNYTVAALALAAIAAQHAGAQESTLKVVGSDSLPIPYAWISVGGAIPTIANESGQLGLGKVRNKTLSFEIRRIGYQPWTGKLNVPDGAATLTVTLSSVTENAVPAAITRARQKNLLEGAGFYARWLQKQKDGLRDATFIGPEAIEKRQAGVTTDLLDNVIGVILRTDTKGVHAATGTGERPAGGMGEGATGGSSAKKGGSSGGAFLGAANRNECYLSVLIDGSAVCPNVGCHYVFASDPPGSTAEDHSVDLDRLVTPKSIAGIEVYPRRDGMPNDVLKVYDGCGVVVIWTTGRR